MRTVLTLLLTTAIATLAAGQSAIANLPGNDKTHAPSLDAPAAAVAHPPTPVSPVTWTDHQAIDSDIVHKGRGGRERRSSTTSTMASAAILFPAYIYPVAWTSPAAWYPLYSAVQSYPGVTFHIVINPNSGPGGSTPNADYALAIQTLKKFGNVVLLGYVHTLYATRSPDLVMADIDTYVSWSASNNAMDGIFFDEAPQTVSDASYLYMANITCHAKTTMSTAVNGGSPMVYFNPGTKPDVRYYTLADYVVVFEDTYASYLSNADSFSTNNSGNKASCLPMTRSTFVIHSMDAGWTQQQMTSFINGIVNGTALGSVFLTSSTDQDNPYGSFSSDWFQFVAGVDALRTLA